MSEFFKKVIGKLLQPIMSSDSSGREETSELSLNPRRSSRIMQKQRKRLVDDKRLEDLKRRKTKYTRHLITCVQQEFEMDEVVDEEEMEGSEEQTDVEGDQEGQEAQGEEQEEGEDDEQGEGDEENEEQEDDDGNVGDDDDDDDNGDDDQAEENRKIELEELSHEVLRNPHNSAQGLGFTRCVCAELNGEFYKLYDLPDNVEYLVPRRGRRSL